MPTRTPAKSTKTVAKRNTEVIVPKFAEVKETDFPAVVRQTKAASEFGPLCDGINAGKRYALDCADKEASEKLTAQIRQVYRRLHNKSLTAVYVASDRKLYVKDGGAIKPRNTNGKK